jgi:hypothetical protein
VTKELALRITEVRSEDVSELALPGDIEGLSALTTIGCKSNQQEESLQRERARILVSVITQAKTTVLDLAKKPPHVRSVVSRLRKQGTSFAEQTSKQFWDLVETKQHIDAQHDNDHLSYSKIN